MPDEADSCFEGFFDPAEFELRASLEDRHYWHLYRRELIFDVLRSMGASHADVLLELGCGAGTVATYLNERGLRVDYSDVHRSALIYARRRAAARLRLAEPAPRFVRVDITRQLPPGDYDGALLLDVLEHLPDDVATLSAVRTLLESRSKRRSEAGRFPFVLFTVPAFQALWSPWDDRERHKRRYTVSSARALAERAGFDVERATYFFFPLFFAAAGVKVARKVSGLLRGPARDVALQDMVETRDHPALNAVLLRILGMERRILREHDLPLGTSVLVVARLAPS